MGGVEEALLHPDTFCRLAELVRETLDSEVLERWVRSRLTVAEILDLAVDVLLNEREANWDAAAELRSTAGRSAVVKLWLRGFETTEIALIVNQPEGRITNTVKHTSALGRTIVGMYLAGVDVSTIGRQCDRSRNVIYKNLASAGIVLESRQTPTELKNKVIRLREAGAGYEEIRKKSGLDTSTIRNTLRAAAKRGTLTNYGKGAA
jgi:DNA-directed RNA polymerase specialized sigma24 family protein